MRSWLAGVVVLLPLTALVAPGAAAPACSMKNPDTIVHGIVVGDSKTAVRRIGRNEKLKLTLPEPTSSFPWAVFFSSDGKQTLALQQYPGGGIDDYMMSEVALTRLGANATLSDEDSRYMGKASKKQKLPAVEFVTGRGIKLGVTKAEVLKRLGASCIETLKTEGGSETVRYQFEEAEPEKMPAFLKAANMPEYLAEYQFESGKLVRFRFGYPYP